jgi:hypothetical protein
MAKDKRKIYKAVKKNIDDKDCLVIKYKNLRPLDVRELRTEINILTTDFFVQEEPQYQQQAQDASYTMSYPQKEVHFEEKESSSILKNHGPKTRCKTSR